MAQEHEGLAVFGGYKAELICPIPYTTAVQIVERAARTCYQSTMAETVEGAETFIKSLIKRGHESVLEHVSYTMAVTIDRGILAEWTRHRIGSAYSVESTRYVNYTKKQAAIIYPSTLDGKQADMMTKGVLASLVSYQSMIDAGVKPEDARAVLPQSLAVHMVVTHNIRQWRHIIKERLLNGHAHHSFREVMRMCFDQLYNVAPCFFEDQRVEVSKRDD